MCTIVVERVMMSVTAISLNLTECLLNISGIYSVCYSIMQPLRNFLNIGYVSLCTHERDMPSFSMFLLHRL